MSEEQENITFTPVHNFITKKFEGATLVLALVSVGEVPQKAVELLVENLPEITLVGHLNITSPNKTWEKFAGPTGLEILGSKHRSSPSIFYLSQAKSSPAEESQLLTKSIVNFVRSHKFQNLLVLTSTSKQKEFTAGDSPSDAFQILSIPSQPSVIGFHTDFPSFSDLPVYTHESTGTSTLPKAEEERGVESNLPFLPGAGLTKEVIIELGKTEVESGVRVGVIVGLVDDDKIDHKEDAKSMAELVKNTLILGSVPEWKEPKSWSQKV